MLKQEKSLYSLIPLDDFKAVLCIDDREDKIARYCLTTATFSIEQYCKRRLLRKKHFERIEYSGDVLLPLREYPVQKVLAVYTGNGEILEPELYEVFPDCGDAIDVPFSLSLSPALKRYQGLTSIKAIYWAGYKTGKIPPDLASACLELAAWYMSRYRGRRIGITGTFRGNGRDGERLESSMPENVRSLLEPYRRKTI